MRKKVVFVMGVGRSGSTLLDLMIGSNPDAFSLGEISKLPEFVKKKKKLCEASNFWEETFSLEELERIAAGISNHRLNKYVPLKLERLIREIFRRDEILNPYLMLFSKIDKNVLVDSSKYVDWILKKIRSREFRQGVIDAYILHIIRDGRAVMNSYLRADPELTVSEFSHNWVKQLKERNKLYEQLPANRKLVVRYEELASNPEATLKRICKLLELEYTPEMIEYWKHDHHQIVGSRSTRAFIARHKGIEEKEATEQIHGNYYKSMPLSIKLDLRWKKELSSDKVEDFNRIVGDMNKPYEWNE